MSHTLSEVQSLKYHQGIQHAWMNMDNVHHTTYHCDLQEQHCFTDICFIMCPERLRELLALPFSGLQSQLTLE